MAAPAQLKGTEHRPLPPPSTDFYDVTETLNADELTLLNQVRAAWECRASRRGGSMLRCRNARARRVTGTRKEHIDMACVISGALLFIIPDFHLGPAAQGFVVGVVTLGALAGALLGGSWVYVQPDVQGVLRPSGTGRVPDALVLAVQLGVTL